MALLHLLGNSFHAELFRHHLISSDGRIIATDEKLKKYPPTLIEKSKERTRCNYRERKPVVDEIQKLLRYEDSSKEDVVKDLLAYLKKINLHFTADGTIESSEEIEPESWYLGPENPRRNIHERKLAIRKFSKRIQRSDMRNLKEWLSRVSDPKARTATPATRTPEEWKEEKFKYIARTQNVWKALARNRQRNIRKPNQQNKWINAMNQVLDRIQHSHEMIAIAANYTSRCSSPFRYRPKSRDRRSKSRDRRSKSRERRSRSGERRPRSGERAAAKKNAKAVKLGAKKDGNSAVVEQENATVPSTEENREEGDVKLQNADDTPT